MESESALLLHRQEVQPESPGHHWPQQHHPCRPGPRGPVVGRAGCCGIDPIPDVCLVLQVSAAPVRMKLSYWSHGL